MFLELMLVGLGIGKNATDSYKQNQKVKQMSAQGAFLPTDYQRWRMIHSDVFYDWLGERKLYPKEYWEYFERSKEALKRYQTALVSQQEAKEGRQPVICPGIYNKFTFNAFAGFNSCYGEYIRIFNETGKFYQ